MIAEREMLFAPVTYISSDHVTEVHVAKACDR